MVGVVLLAAAPAALLVLALALVVQLLRPTKPQLRLASFPHPAWLYAQVPFTLGKRASIQAVPLIQVTMTASSSSADVARSLPLLADGASPQIAENSRPGTRPAALEMGRCILSVPSMHTEHAHQHQHQAKHAH